MTVNATVIHSFCCTASAKRLIFLQIFVLLARNRRKEAPQKRRTNFFKKSSNINAIRLRELCFLLSDKPRSFNDVHSIYSETYSHHMNTGTLYHNEFQHVKSFPFFHHKYLNPPITSTGNRRVFSEGRRHAGRIITELYCGSRGDEADGSSRFYHTYQRAIRGRHRTGLSCHHFIYSFAYCLNCHNKGSLYPLFHSFNSVADSFTSFASTHYRKAQNPPLHASTPACAQRR